MNDRKCEIRKLFTSVKISKSKLNKEIMGMPGPGYSLLSPPEEKRSSKQSRNSWPHPGHAQDYQSMSGNDLKLTWISKGEAIAVQGVEIRDASFYLGTLAKKRNFRGGFSIDPSLKVQSPTKGVRKEHLSYESMPASERSTFLKWLSNGAQTYDYSSTGIYIRGLQHRLLFDELKDDDFNAACTELMRVHDIENTPNRARCDIEVFIWLIHSIQGRSPTEWLLEWLANGYKVMVDILRLTGATKGKRCYNAEEALKLVEIDDFVRSKDAEPKKALKQEEECYFKALYKPISFDTWKDLITLSHMSVSCLEYVPGIFPFSKSDVTKVEKQIADAKKSSRFKKDSDGGDLVVRPVNITRADFRRYKSLRDYILGLRDSLVSLAGTEIPLTNGKVIDEHVNSLDLPTSLREKLLTAGYKTIWAVMTADLRDLYSVDGMTIDRVDAINDAITCYILEYNAN